MADYKTDDGYWDLPVVVPTDIGTWTHEGEGLINFHINDLEYWVCPIAQHLRVGEHFVVAKLGFKSGNHVYVSLGREEVADREMEELDKQMAARYDTH